MASITISVQSFLNSATNLSITIDDGQTVAQLKTAINAAEGTPTAIMDLFLNGIKLTDATTLAASGLISGSFVKTSNNLTEVGLWTKQQRQEYKLQLAALRRADLGNIRSVYDISELPAKYSGNDIVDNVNEGGLVVGRPWSTSETPNLIAGLRFWIDTATTSTLNGGTYTDGATLTAWTERKAAATFTSQAANRRPTIQSGAGDLQNGYPVVRFAADVGLGDWDQAEWTSVSGLADVTGYTMICVAKLSINASATNNICNILNTGGTFVCRNYYAAGTGRFELIAPNGGFVTVDNTVDPDGTWKIVTVRYDSTQAVAANRFTFRWAKTARTVTVGATSPSGALTSTATRIQVGYFTPADFGEMMVYNTALTDAQIIALEDYLSSKWGV